MRIGTAGWPIAAVHRQQFSSDGSLLRRYASRFNAVEINSSFYRPHRRSTYERWRVEVPDDFRFSVKLPRSITHEKRLKDYNGLLARFVEEVEGLGEKLGVILVQLPPSLPLVADDALKLFKELKLALPVPIACEPRHPDWFTPEAERLLADQRIARVAADPSRAPGADLPGGWRGIAYVRLHGSPRIYYSNYDETALARIEEQLAEYARSADTVWCIFDNTAEFHATANALTLMERLNGASQTR